MTNTRPSKTVAVVMSPRIVARASAAPVVLALLINLVHGSPARPCPEILAEFDVRPHGDVVTVPVIIHGRAYPFVLDTATSTWVFDASLRGMLGAPCDRVAAEGPNDTIAVTRYATPPMRVGALPPIAPSSAVCLELREAFTHAGHDIYGVVGADFLRGKVFRIDFDRGKLQFLRAPTADAGERFPLILTDDRPRLRIDLPDAGTEDFLLGTGHCNFTTGSLRAAAYFRLVAAGRLRRLGDEGSEIRSYSPVGGIAADHPAELNRFAVGTFKHEGLIFNHAQTSILGLGYLSRYTVTFDLAHAAVFLKPGRDYGRADMRDHAGLELSRIDRAVIVSRVAPGSASARSGIKKNDRVVEIDGVPVAGLTPFELNRMLMIFKKHRIRFVRPSVEDLEREVTILPLEPRNTEPSRR